MDYKYFIIQDKEKIMCYKKTSLLTAYNNGLRNCPCCGVQLVWKAYTANIQKNLATVDHIVPRSIGGSDIFNNMYVMCRKCNETRGNMCFVTFVTKNGVSKEHAESIYKKAFTSVLQHMIFQQFTIFRQCKENEEYTSLLREMKKKRKNLRLIVSMYTEYFKDYLPEFTLLQKLM